MGWSTSGQDPLRKVKGPPCYRARLVRWGFAYALWSAVALPPVSSQAQPEEDDLPSKIPVWLLYAAMNAERPTDTKTFRDATAQSGIYFTSGVNIPGNSELVVELEQSIPNGAAAGDYDNDGDIDLLFTRGDLGGPLLYRNDGGLRFSDVTSASGLSEATPASGSPALVDMDGDFDLDAIIIGFAGQATRVYINDGHGGFSTGDQISGLSDMSAAYSMSPAFGDYDGDGDLDLALGHWGTPRITLASQQETETLWRNDSSDEGFVFTPVSRATGVSPSIWTQNDPYAPSRATDTSFTPTFTDIDGDGDSDLLVVADFDRTKVFKNIGNGLFENVTDAEVIRDRFGMGSAVGDIDGDGDLDWFVTSIRGDDDGALHNGNKLYRNDDGVFVDVTETAGVADGGWGWGACFLDVENDGDLDIYHGNGWPSLDYLNQHSRVFINNGLGVFQEKSQALGLNDTNSGRGTICADLDNDGDIDVVQLNHNAEGAGQQNSVSVWENLSSNSFLTVKLRGNAPNTGGVGAKVRLMSPGIDQIREVRLGNNFTTQNPLTQYFGLGSLSSVDIVEVTWPDGRQTSRFNVPANQSITIEQPASDSVRVTVNNASGSGYYQVGDLISLTAPPAQHGYSFSHWSVSGSDLGSSPFESELDFVVPEAETTITANFIPGPSPMTNVSPFRRWNEVLLEAIRLDYARPVVHARNLFHFSAANYDIWSALAGEGAPWLLGQSQSGVDCEPFDASVLLGEANALEVAVGAAMSQLLSHRFASSPGKLQILKNAAVVGEALELLGGYSAESPTLTEAAALGAHVANCYIEMGLTDGANEEADYANRHYQPVNPPLNPEDQGNPGLIDFNRFQELTLTEFIDQSGNPLPSTPEFLGAEWGSVYPFALDPDNAIQYERDGEVYQVYLDQGPPPQLGSGLDDIYHWGFLMVAVWSSHLDPSDATMIDISPASIGNLPPYPADWEAVKGIYEYLTGGDTSTGWEANPATGEPYSPQWVPRGDYARVLAEFWADGPQSETPPGHWFVILNTVVDHELFEPRFEGAGVAMTHTEWDAKAYFTLAGAMHDAAIAAWGMKGWYDYIRPLSAIRAMAGVGQSSQPEAADYSPYGLSLLEGYVERVAAGDPLAGSGDVNVGKLKLKTWRGPGYIDDAQTDIAGVGWILAENWWPYQRPTFVTPPFAGYVSGHSTYSSAAAEVLERLTGDAFFPGGKSEFHVVKDEFLVFERGPSQDLVLEWATYRDAADQCSLSRIWGGIHPPVDDIPGRIIGKQVGGLAFDRAKELFESIP